MKRLQKGGDVSQSTCEKEVRDVVVQSNPKGRTRARWYFPYTTFNSGTASGSSSAILLRRGTAGERTHRWGLEASAWCCRPSMRLAARAIARRGKRGRRAAAGGRAPTGAQSWASWASWAARACATTRRWPWRSGSSAAG
eukprot:2306907-Pleurochrysis_carterae.AAC.1